MLREKHIDTPILGNFMLNYSENLLIIMISEKLLHVANEWHAKGNEAPLLLSPIFY